MKPTECACGSSCAPRTGCRSEPRWTFETFHTAACRRQLEDPGNGCICRPPNETTKEQQP